jgi:hypothetical protein
MNLDLVKTPSFQQFLSVHDPNTDASWDEVKKRVISYCILKGKTLDDKFVKVALGLAKYDLNGAPSNWEPQYNHENTIFDWAEWVLTHRFEGRDEEEIEEYEQEIDYIIETYEDGLIPDCYSLLEEYF